VPHAIAHEHLLDRKLPQTRSFRTHYPDDFVTRDFKRLVKSENVVDGPVACPHEPYLTSGKPLVRQPSLCEIRHWIAPKFSRCDWQCSQRKLIDIGHDCSPKCRPGGLEGLSVDLH
jgi:hypothetical protein